MVLSFWKKWRNTFTDKIEHNITFHRLVMDEVV